MAWNDKRRIKTIGIDLNIHTFITLCLCEQNVKKRGPIESLLFIWLSFLSQDIFPYIILASSPKSVG